MNIDENLIYLRNKNNLTQKEVADFPNIERKTYVNWEADNAPIKKYLHSHVSEIF